MAWVLGPIHQLQSISGDLRFYFFFSNKAPFPFSEFFSERRGNGWKSVFVDCMLLMEE